MLPFPPRTLPKVVLVLPMITAAVGRTERGWLKARTDEEWPSGL